MFKDIRGQISAARARVEALSNDLYMQLVKVNRLVEDRDKDHARILWLDWMYDRLLTELNVLREGYKELTNNQPFRALVSKSGERWTGDTLEQLTDLTTKGLTGVAERLNKLEEDSKTYDERLAAQSRQLNSHNQQLLELRTELQMNAKLRENQATNPVISYHRLARWEPQTLVPAVPGMRIRLEPVEPEPQQEQSGELHYDKPVPGFAYGSRVYHRSFCELFHRLNAKEGLARPRQDKLDVIDGMRAGFVIPRPAGLGCTALKGGDSSDTLRRMVYVLCDDGKVRASRAEHLKVARSHRYVIRTLRNGL